MPGNKQRGARGWNVSGKTGNKGWKKNRPNNAAKRRRPKKTKTIKNKRITIKSPRYFTKT
jgi:hypothetical protein|tara:strand:- start:231 stop:410 length:180 start_codon:yes stop_codon:yes gene_type:complete